MGCRALVLVGCALIAVVIASSDETILLQELDDPAPHVPIQTPDERLVNAKKGSAEGPADPGYGPASASRTDEQRAHETDQEAREQLSLKKKRTTTRAGLLRGATKNRKGQKRTTYVFTGHPLDPLPGRDTRKTTNAINKRIEELGKQQTEASTGKADTMNTLTQIKRQSEKIKTKFRKAQTFLKAAIAAQKTREAKEAEEGGEEDANQPGDEDEAAAQSKEAAHQAAIVAEVGKLKQEEINNGVDTTAGPSFVDESEKIDIAPSGNWVHPNRTRKEKKGGRKKGKKTRRGGKEEDKEYEEYEEDKDS